MKLKTPEKFTEEQRHVWELIQAEKSKKQPNKRKLINLVKRFIYLDSRPECVDALKGLRLDPGLFGEWRKGDEVILDGLFLLRVVDKSWLRY